MPDRPTDSHVQPEIDRWLRLRSAGKPDEAARLYRDIASRATSSHFDEVHRLGVAQVIAGNAATAVEILDLALGIDPANAPAQCHRGNALHALRRWDEALASYERALAINPQYVLAFSNRSVTLHEMKRYADAIDSCDAALRIAPHNVPALYNRANSLLMMGRYEDALASYEAALALEPDHANALANRGQALHALKRYTEALRSYDLAIEKARNPSEALNNRGNLLREIGDLEGAAESHRRYVALNPDHAFGHTVLIFTLLRLSEDGIEVDTRCRAFEERFEQKTEWFSHDNSPLPERRLRIGYVSADLREHPVAYHIAPILENHGDAFETYCYCDHDRDDAVTERLMSLADRWQRTANLTDEELAASIRRDEIDILVDLSGHTTHNRLLVFSQKPAPVQVTWLGLPASTGLAAVDYRLTDDHVDPPGLTERHHSERLVGLSSHACYLPPSGLPPVNPLPALRRGYVTFGSFNRIDKVTSRTYTLWAGVLDAVPQSKLQIVCDSALFEIVGRRFAERGIEEGRLIFVRSAPLVDYLRWHNMVDIALDTFPFNGGTVTRNALWMGVPVVTLAGSVSVSRVGLALMTQIGLADFVATTPEQYVDVAKRWSDDPEGLASIRATLRERMQSAAFSDGAGYTQALERVYRRMWRAWCEQDSPVRIVRR